MPRRRARSSVCGRLGNRSCLFRLQHVAGWLLALLVLLWRMSCRAAVRRRSAPSASRGGSAVRLCHPARPSGGGRPDQRRPGHRCHGVAVHGRRSPGSVVARHRRPRHARLDAQGRTATRAGAGRSSCSKSTRAAGVRACSPSMGRRGRETTCIAASSIWPAARARRSSRASSSRRGAGSSAARGTAFRSRCPSAVCR